LSPNLCIGILPSLSASCCVYRLTGPVPHIGPAFSTGSCSLEKFRDIDLKICLCILFFLCLTVSPSSPDPTVSASYPLDQSYPSLYYINPLSPFNSYPFGTRIGLFFVESADTNKLICTLTWVLLCIGFTFNKPNSFCTVLLYQFSRLAIA
jgi:hypothetical protein